MAAHVHTAPKGLPHLPHNLSCVECPVSVFSQHIMATLPHLGLPDKELDGQGNIF